MKTLIFATSNDDIADFLVFPLTSFDAQTPLSFPNLSHCAPFPWLHSQFMKTQGAA